MLIIALDESGSFENSSSAVKLIGGLIYNAKEVEKENLKDEFNKEEKKIEEFLKNLCSEIDIKYPTGIHAMDILDNKKKYKLKEAVKNYLKESGNYYFTAIIKGKDGKQNYINESNLVNDKYASNLYERMAWDLVKNILFYNRNLKDEKNVYLEVASRSVPILSEEIEEIEKYKNLGYRFNTSYNRKSKKEETWFYLTNQQTFKAAISNIMIENNISKNIETQINVESINYHRTEKDKNRKTTPFLYLADLACDILRENINPRNADFNIRTIVEETKKITMNDSLLWGYDDIDDIFCDIYDNFQAEKYIETLEVIYKFKNSKSKFKTFYESYWVKNIIDNVDKIFKEESLSLYVDKVDRYLGKNTIHSQDNIKDYNLGIYIAENIWNIIKDDNTKDNILKYKLADYLVMGYNHKGNIKKAKEFFYICNKMKRIAGEENFRGTCLSLAQISSNEFDFDSASEYMEKALEITLNKNKVNESDSFSIFEDTYVEENEKEKDILLGKIYSSLGQINTFKKEYDKALEYFMLALNEFEFDKDNTRFTTSLLLHLLLEIKDKENYDKYAEIYFSSKVLEEQMNNIINRYGKDRFALYILIKSIVIFNLEIDINLLNLIEEIQVTNDEVWVKGGHPWEIIYKYLAIIFANKDKGEMTKLSIKKLSDFINDDEENITLRIISLYNEISLIFQNHKNNKELQIKINKLKDIIDKNENIKKYFEPCFETNNVDEIIKSLDRKISYYYS